MAQKEEKGFQQLWMLHYWQGMMLFDMQKRELKFVQMYVYNGPNFQFF